MSLKPETESLNLENGNYSELPNWNKAARRTGKEPCIKEESPLEPEKTGNPGITTELVSFDKNKSSEIDKPSAGKIAVCFCNQVKQQDLM